MEKVELHFTRPTSSLIFGECSGLHVATGYRIAATPPDSRDTTYPHPQPRRPSGSPRRCRLHPCRESTNPRPLLLAADPKPNTVSPRTTGLPATVACLVSVQAPPLKSK